MANGPLDPMPPITKIVDVEQFAKAQAGRVGGGVERTDPWDPHDPVNHPAHYKQGGIEVIDCIEAWGLGFCLGNTVKYIARAGKKDATKTIEDLKKAAWYLNREIEQLEKNHG